MKGFVAAQHAKGRHVVLWVPLAQADGLPESLCIWSTGNASGADVGKPEYEALSASARPDATADLQ